MNAARNVSYHLEDNHPVDPEHIELGFLLHDDFPDSTTDRRHGEGLSDVCFRLWAFFAMFYNHNDTNDHYASSVKNIIEDLDFKIIDKFSAMQPLRSMLQPNVAHKSSSTIRDCASVHTKAALHIHYHFAGSYKFPIPNDGSSIVVHRGRGGDSILVHGTQHIFSIADGSGEEPHYDILERHVCFKFMSNEAVYQRERNWRREIVDRNTSKMVVPLLEDFDVSTCVRFGDKLYKSDCVDERFRMLPLRRHQVTNEVQEWLDMTNYPFATVYPFSFDGNLRDMISRESMDDSTCRQVAHDMARLLDQIHKKGDNSQHTMFYELSLQFCPLT